MLVLANEMFDSPPVFAWFLPAFVRPQPGLGGFFSSVTVTLFFHVADISRSRQTMPKEGGGNGQGRGKGKGKESSAGVGSTYADTGRH